MSPPYRSTSCCVAFLAWLGFIRLGGLEFCFLVPNPPPANRFVGCRMLVSCWVVVVGQLQVKEFTGVFDGSRMNEHNAAIMVIPRSLSIVRLLLFDIWLREFKFESDAI